MTAGPVTSSQEVYNSRPAMRSGTDGTPADLAGIVAFADAHCHGRPLCDTCALVLRSVEDELRRRHRVVDWLAELQDGQAHAPAEVRP